MPWLGSCPWLLNIVLPVWLMALVGACATESGEDAGPATRQYEYRACDASERVGGFRLLLEQPGAGEPYTTFSGWVEDAVDPELLAESTMSIGDCSLMVGSNNFCDPKCSADERCDVDGQCVPKPVRQNAGLVQVEGMVDGPLSIEPREGRFNYEGRGFTTYPGFQEGARIDLWTEGGTLVPMAFVAEGVAELSVQESEVPLVEGEAAMVTWDPPAASGRTRMLVDLNVTLHGGTGPRIECDTEDDGSLEIAAELVGELLKVDYSGFPGITLKRQTSDAVEGPGGCVDLVVSSAIDRHPVQIEGLFSCSPSTGILCPDGMVCDLVRLQCYPE